jgi:hypothetical protein
LAAFTAEFFLPPLVRQDRKLLVIAIFAGALKYAALGREMDCLQGRSAGAGWGKEDECR